MVVVEADGAVSVDSPRPFVAPSADGDEEESSDTWMVPAGERTRKPSSA